LQLRRAGSGLRHAGEPGQRLHGDPDLLRLDLRERTAIPLVIGAAAVSGTTIGAHDNYDAGLEGASCTNFAQPGGDVAYSVVLAASTGYTFTLAGLDATYDGSLSLVGPAADATACTANPITTCVAGADAGANGATETFSYTTPAAGAGTYYVIVDSFAPVTAPNSEGAFTIGVTSP
jgi:hypothetical protein